VSERLVLGRKEGSDREREKGFVRARARDLLYVGRDGGPAESGYFRGPGCRRRGWLSRVVSARVRPLREAGPRASLSPLGFVCIGLTRTVLCSLHLPISTATAQYSAAVTCSAPHLRELGAQRYRRCARRFCSNYSALAFLHPTQ